MANKGELWGTLTGLNATLLNRWSSAWSDLQAADMALHERRKLDDSKMANVFHRRALWESAVASYGRCAVSNRKRKIAFKDFVAEILGDEGLAVHERIMDWRHGHVAHRNGAEFESVETGFTYANGPAHPTSINVALEIDAGPPNSAEFVTTFEDHVKTVRDALWEQKLFPLAASVVDDVNAGRIARPAELHVRKDRSGEEGRYTLNLNITTLGGGKSIP
ncbi:hypothetical protein [Mycolicibacterium palauense]|uniref:hypothetical protein n=1 Tax=Mycolicibacterium palauense TaxID=2034511 RepID=UPI000BFEDC01|nr:hypothetical protein [Mycolicibacterium palauense]